MLLHGAALVWWMGLLPPLLADLRHVDAALHLRRFSTIAVPLVALLVVSGGWLTFAQTGGDWRGLPQSTWGLVLLAKLALVAALLALAGVNRLRLTPALTRGAPPAAMQRSIRAEIAFGLVVLMLAASFRLAPPPRAFELPAAPILIHLHSDRAMADLRVTPGRAGPVVIEMAFQTGDFSDLTPREVHVALTPADGSLEPIRTRAMPQPGGLWSTPELVLPFAGDWEIALRVLITDFDSVVLLEMVTLPR
jgi:copper transport protein